ncbi:cell wall anchor protein [Nucisporomicrobium flavum]|uniref:cell wall anchor protein n=1 Tax=Nucisporomicrobium flavum TaxID=2785915 RepID=UPI0018F73D5A|nr:cell wall anchor protein [Nucisporomicrobium flavum]
MKLNSPLRRAATVLAGALIGLGGAAAVTAPASAHASNVSGAAVCDTATGTRIVTWTLTNDYPTDATVADLKTTPTEVEKSAEGNLVIPHAQGRSNGELTLTQQVTGDAKEAAISFRSIWSSDGYEDQDNSAKVDLSEPCAPAETPCVEAGQASFHHRFGVTEKGSTATVSLDDGVKLCEGEPVTLVSYFAPKPQFAVPQYKYDSETGSIDNEHRSVTLNVDVPDCNTQVDLFFGGEDDIIGEITEGGPRYGDKKLGSNGGPGGRSKGPQGWYNGGGKGCQTPAVEPLSQCDGTVQLNLSNTGEISRYAVDFTVKAGDFSQTVTVKPGKGETVTVPAGAGTVTVSAEGMDDVTYDWKAPEDCALPTVIVENDCDTVAITVENPEGVTPATAKITYGGKSETVTVAAGKSEKVTFDAGKATYATVEFPGLDVEPIKATLEKLDCDNGGGAGGGDSDEPGLPVTGPVAGSIAGGAALLLIAGAVLFITARRRRIRFTA